MKKTPKIAEHLSHLLANTYTLYLKTQNFHWNVTGPHFHSLHKMFEEQYQELANSIDEIAERIRALGKPAPGSFSEFLKLSYIKDAAGSANANDMVKKLLADHERIIEYIAEVFPDVEEAQDEATVDLLNKRTESHEKTAWMLRSSVA